MRLTIHLSASSGDMLSLSASMLIKRQEHIKIKFSTGQRKEAGVLDRGESCQGLHGMTGMHLNYFISPFVLAQIIESKNVQWS